jgi:YHS domain-containing protein
LEVFEQYKSEINGRGLYFFNLLIKVRKDDRCSSVHEKIDEFIAESEFMKFASNPSAYTELDNIEPEWLLYCEEEDFRRLVREEVVNKKMKDSFDKDEFRGSLKKKFLREA